MSEAVEERGNDLVQTDDAYAQCAMTDFVRQPRTAPVTRPFTSRPCANQTKISVGITMSTPAADMAPQSMPYCVTKLVRPTGSVCASLLEVRVSAMQEVVPGEEEGDDGAGAEAGRDHRRDDLHQGPQRAGAIHLRGFLDLLRQVLDEAHQQPDRDRQLRGGVA